jgi:putative endonuclease
MAGARRRCLMPSAFVYSGPMSAARQALGELGERIAERWLRERGWRVMQRRFRSGHRDIDLVVERDGVVAFVEVKARRGSGFGGPIEAVNWRKQKELGRSARVWVDRHGRPLEAYRFDVIGVLVAGSRVRIRHVPNAFPLHLSA